MLVVLTLPARSATEPATVVEPLPATTWSAGHAPAAIPDSASVQVKCTVTGPSYTPPGPGARSGVAVIVGLVRSTLTGPMDVVAVLPATSTAVPAAVWLAPSLKTRGAVHDAMPDSESPQVNVPVTGALY